MKKVLLTLAVLALLIVYVNRTKSGYKFVALCPPRQMPASYTASDETCVQYVF